MDREPCRHSPAQEKEASLPSEPDASERAGVTLCAVRLPDGTRPARRFRQTDPLRLLFDFVDAKVRRPPPAVLSLLPHPGRVRLSLPGVSWVKVAIHRGPGPNTMLDPRSLNAALVTAGLRSLKQIMA